MLPARSVASAVVFLLGTCAFAAQKPADPPAKDPPAKIEKLTAKNVEVDRTGTIDRLVVTQADSDASYLVAKFDGIKVVVSGYPTKGIGVGKVLPADQVWRVTGVVERDLGGDGLVGSYILKPDAKTAVLKADPKKPKDKGKPKKK